SCRYTGTGQAGPARPRSRSDSPSEALPDLHCPAIVANMPDLAAAPSGDGARPNEVHTGIEGGNRTLADSQGDQITTFLGGSVRGLDAPDRFRAGTARPERLAQRRRQQRLSRTAARAGTRKPAHPARESAPRAKVPCRLRRLVQPVLLHV